MYKCTFSPFPLSLLSLSVLQPSKKHTMPLLPSQTSLRLLHLWIAFPGWVNTILVANLQIVPSTDSIRRLRTLN